MTLLDGYPGISKWVKVFAAGALAVAVAMIALTLAGVRDHHGPARHMERAAAERPVAAAREEQGQRLTEGAHQ